MSGADAAFDLAGRLKEGRARVEATLERVLPEESGPADTVVRAMRYAVLGGGKRLRPILVLEAAAACGGPHALALEAAAGVELLHAYSLIHDDLPCMDDDDLRRGRPSVHRAFDEATAVLAGDALHTLAFELLNTHPAGVEHAERRSAAAVCLARAAGVGGMVGGQVADLEAEHHAVDATRLVWIHRHKTGALFGASTEIGGILAGADATRREALARYGRSLGLAFQITDDILDETATAQALGKTPGKDRRAGKATFPGLLGLARSRQEADRSVEEACRALQAVDLSSPALEALARGAVTRSR